MDFQDHSRKENLVSFLKKIRYHNPERKIMIVLDNFKSHHAKLVAETALQLDMKLVYSPPYSPDLNPIEFIWKSIKRVISTAKINSRNDLTGIIETSFMELSGKQTFAKRWIEKFLDKDIIM